MVQQAQAQSIKYLTVSDIYFYKHSSGTDIRAQLLCRITIYIIGSLPEQFVTLGTIAFYTAVLVDAG